ncbi:hypothetical protein ACEN2T_17845 [Pseudomonas sp. W22_MBD1_FP4]|uniref:hypothetical protein n=1 Tax=Pseudomonas sp. W22_MBD1_FP4 TaxID=3240272 RepID=UPI003F96E75C
MKTSLKALLIAVVVASTATLAGCNTTQKFLADGQARYDAEPAAYEAITGQANYLSATPEINVHGS